MIYNEDFTRDDHIQQLVGDCYIDDSHVVDALFVAIHEAMDNANVPNDLRQDVFNMINDNCIIRT